MPSAATLFSGRSAGEVITYSLRRDGADLLLAPNFKLIEFACRCPRNAAETFLYNGVAYYDTVLVHPALPIILQAARYRFGLPLRITSAYRPTWHNSNLPDSADNSNHTRGVAVDVVMAGVSPQVLGSFFRDALSAGGTGVETDGHVHVSLVDEGGADHTITDGRRYFAFDAVFSPADAMGVLASMAASGTLSAALPGYALGEVTVTGSRRATAAVAVSFPLWIGVGLAAGAVYAALQERA